MPSCSHSWLNGVAERYLSIQYYFCMEAGFPTGVENMGRGGALQNLMGGLKSIHGGSMGGLKMLSKNTCDGVHLIVAGYKPASLQIY